MTHDEIASKVQDIFRDVFDDDALTISRATNSADIEDWDSLAQISLVVAIEKEFRIRCSLDELATLSDVGDMLDLIAGKIAG